MPSAGRGHAGAEEAAADGGRSGEADLGGRGPAGSWEVGASG